MIWCEVKVALLNHVHLCNPMDYTVYGILQEILPFPGDLPNPGIEPRCPALQADSLLAESPGKLYDPKDVCNLISGFSAFPKSRFNIWKFSVHLLLKPNWKH